MANKTKIKASLLSNKRIKQSGVGRKTVKLTVPRNSRIRIKKA